MKSKILLFLIIFFVFVSSCARFSSNSAYLYIPELYHKSGVEAYNNGNITHIKTYDNDYKLL